MQLDIADIKKLDVRPGDTLIVEVNVSQIPQHNMKSFMDNAAKTLRLAIPDTSIQILVVVDGHTKFTVEPGNGARSIVPKPVDPQSDYERAMKGL